MRVDPTVGPWLAHLTPEQRAVGRLPHLFLEAQFFAKVRRGIIYSRETGRAFVARWMEEAQRDVPELPESYWRELHESFTDFFKRPLRHYR